MLSQWSSGVEVTDLCAGRELVLAWRVDRSGAEMLTRPSEQW